jgi:hypothetical protein
MKTMAAPALDIQASKQAGEMQLASGGRNVAAEIANSMASEMVTNANSSTCANIRAKWQSNWPNDKLDALRMWSDMVGYGKPWDHKKFLRDGYGEWHQDTDRNVQWYFDIWSNIHYGYVGRACGFSVGTLLNGAGLAQLLGSNVPGGFWGWLERASTHGIIPALDDSSDQYACTIGTVLWGQNFDGNTLRHLMWGGRSSLTHRSSGNA